MASLLRGSDYGSDGEEEEERENQRKLFSDHQQLVLKDWKAVKESRKAVLRERLRELRLKIGESSSGSGKEGKDRDGGVDPLLIFPVELWALLFEYLNGDKKDLLSCIRTCRLFEKILKELQTNILFEKIFPMIFTKLDRQDVLNCRLVSKSWCGAVESFLESFWAVPKDPSDRKPDEPYTGSGSPEPGGGMDYKFAYFFRIPSRRQNSDRVLHDKHRPAMKLHPPPRNPFIGKFVFLDLKSRNHTILEQNLQSLLDDFGDYIGTLRLFSKAEEWPLSIHTRLYYPMLLQILTKCDSLMSLSLYNVHVDWPHHGLAQDADMNPPLPDHSRLESLQILKCGEDILPIQDTLLRKYSNQLVCLALYDWNRNFYHNLPWGQLRRVEVTGRNSDELFDTLVQMEAPNLTQLATRLDGPEPQFKKLIRVANHFPKLEALQLKFSNNFPGFALDEILKIGSRDPGLRCPAVVSLEVSCKNAHKDCSFNWISNFPHLKRLRVTRPALLMWGDENYYVDEIEEIDEDPDDEPDFLQLKMYLWAEEKRRLKDKCREAVYKSSVWSVLPELGFLEIYKGQRECKYSRVGYNHFQKGLVESGK